MYEYDAWKYDETDLVPDGVRDECTQCWAKLITYHECTEGLCQPCERLMERVEAERLEEEAAA